MSVTRIPVNNYRSIISEHWTAETESELRELFAQVERNYPTPGYGTMIYDVRPDPTGLLWHAEFSRGASCD